MMIAFREPWEDVHHKHWCGSFWKESLGDRKDATGKITTKGSRSGVKYSKRVSRLRASMPRIIGAQSKCSDAY